MTDAAGDGEAGAAAGVNEAGLEAEVRLGAGDLATVAKSIAVPSARVILIAADLVRGTKVLALACKLGEGDPGGPPAGEKVEAPGVKEGVLMNGRADCMEGVPGVDD